MWIRRADPEGDDATWEVLDRDGEPMGSLSLPRAQQIVAARGDRLVALELDELDVPFLVVYSLRR